MIQYARVGADEIMTMNVDNRASHTIPGLFASVDYVITMAAVNAKGVGPFSKCVVATSGEDGERNYIIMC